MRTKNAVKTLPGFPLRIKVMSTFCSMYSIELCRSNMKSFSFSFSRPLDFTLQDGAKKLLTTKTAIERIFFLASTKIAKEASSLQNSEAERGKSFFNSILGTYFKCNFPPAFLIHLFFSLYGVCNYFFIFFYFLSLKVYF